MKKFKATMIAPTKRSYEFNIIEVPDFAIALFELGNCIRMNNLEVVQLTVEDCTDAEPEAEPIVVVNGGAS